MQCHLKLQQPLAKRSSYIQHQPISTHGAMTMQQLYYFLTPQNNKLTGQSAQGDYTFQEVMLAKL